MHKLLPLALPALLAGCTVGPHYQGPAATPSAAQFARGDSPAFRPAPPIAHWWETLGDPTLNALETQALAANPDLAAALARVAQARFSLRQERANVLPKANASALYAHAKLPGADFGSITSGGSGSSLDLYNLGFNASWEADLFGGELHAIEATRASAESADASLADAQVALTADVANAYVAIRDRQQRLALVGQASEQIRQMIALTQQRLDKGTASRLDVERLNQRLDANETSALQLKGELTAYLDQIAMLVGAAPGTLDAQLAAVQALPLPPAEVPIADPAALLQRRPDIRVAERTLAADTAKVGQAQAARFPRISFMGLIGIGDTRPEDVTHISDLVALISPQISWSFLDFGKNAARMHQAEAVRDEAEAKYRKAVLVALRDAEDSLSRFDTQRRALATMLRAQQSASTTADLTRQRYQAGTTTLVDLLDSQRQEIEARENVAQAEAALTGDYVAIQKALGLGWGPAA